MAKLVLIATPLGNLGDLSPRAAEALKSADRWFVEDSRVSGKLASYLGIKKSMIAVNEHTAPERIESLVKAIDDDETVALISDAGSPVVSDPGALVVDAAVRLGVDVESVPGPSAVTMALTLSGFFGQRFVFLGFLGRKQGDVRKEMEPFIESPLTIVLFESPHRIEKLLEWSAEIFGPRRFALCRELTKLHEQVWRGTLGDKVPANVPLKGEMTLVIEGRRRHKSVHSD